MKKYSIAVHILFWILVVFLLSAALLFLFSKDYKLSSILPFLKNSWLHQNEKVIDTKVKVSEVKEVEREIEWYYFVASGYSGNDPEQGTDGITATGEEVREGIIAVDPGVIPLGTKIEIKEMGVFTAEDTGGKIKGNRIDIYFNSKKEAKDFGRKGVWIRIISSNYKFESAGLYGNVPLYASSSEYENILAYGYQALNGNTSGNVPVFSD